MTYNEYIKIGPWDKNRVANLQEFSKLETSRRNLMELTGISGN